MALIMTPLDSEMLSFDATVSHANGAVVATDRWTLITCAHAVGGVLIIRGTVPPFVQGTKAVMRGFTLTRPLPQPRDGWRQPTHSRA